MNVNEIMQHVHSYAIAWASKGPFIAQRVAVRAAVRAVAAELDQTKRRVAQLEAERAVLAKGVLAADTVCLFRDTGNDWRAFIEAKDLAQELRRWPVVAKEGK